MTSSAAAWEIAARALALDRAAIDAIGVLEAAGVPVLLLKGPVTATRLYPDAPYAREYCDVDLLVAPTDYDAAQTALAARGYRLASPGVRVSEVDAREVTWLPPESKRLAIDLHRTLAWVGDPTALWTALWRDRTRLSLHGTSVPVPSVVGTALIVALHASLPGNTSKPLHDLARAVEVLEDSHWRAAVELARSAAALAGFAFGLEAVPAARPLLARFDVSTELPTAVRMSGYGASLAGSAIANLMMAGDPRAQVRHIVDRAFPSVAFMHKNWPQTRRGRRALAQAYVARWARLAKSLPRGVRELHDARTAGRDTWTLEALTAVRKQLATTGLRHSQPTPKPGRTVSAASVNMVLDRHSASCLERALVRQRFYAARGIERELVIGVSPPGGDFHAHAWLSGDVGQDEGLEELLRRNS